MSEAIDRLATLFGLEKDAAQRCYQVYKSTKALAIEAAEIANESLQKEGKVLRSKQGIELAADGAGMARMMQQIIFEQIMEGGKTTRDQSQLYTTAMRSQQKLLESIGVFDKLPEDDEKEF